MKSLIYKMVKKMGLTTPYLKLNFTRKKLLRIPPKNFDKLKNFYSPFITGNKLVFDIGTNVGNRTEIFVALGASVVCAEPNRKLFDIVNFRFKSNKKVVALNVGCGAKEEVKEFNIGANHLVSSFSPKFIGHKEMTGENKSWSPVNQVKIVTLDSLIDEYGTPAFCKIDVEGFEKEVIQGLSRKIGIISFEFTSPTFNEETFWCVEKLSQLGYLKFNISFGESLELENSEWLDGERFIKYLEGEPRLQRTTYGDIYVR